MLPTLALMIFAGCMVALQAPINAALARTVGTLESSFISFTVGAVFLGLMSFALGKGQVLRLAETPAWQWVGGVLGACMVFSTVLAVPRIGALATGVAMILGNLFMATVIDHFGWFGLPSVPLDGRRALGLACMLAGLVLVMRR
ncbi:DMT family transporter [Desulfovibrio legallii]|uniref:Transporter family-2 protein n=1 Tax=Desulfovibrio legallii TaxID=571438 RepID=A0A1G7L1Z0_9BACT|nr:DMT family transporter [Desulfovibrio legallii]SDF43381.1 transporter family-2 protein [Desulfovibrio legallii]